MDTRRYLILLFASVAAVWTLQAAAAAGPPTVEIIALSHSPVKTALKPARDFLATLGAAVKVVEIEAESPLGEKRIRAVGLKGHVPIVLLVNGSYRFKRADGTAVDFTNFPAKADNPFGLNGTWAVADFEAAVKAALGGK